MLGTHQGAVDTAGGDARLRLPQLDGRICLTEAGLETELVFHHGIDLPDFASFPLLESESGSITLREYYESFIELARRHDTGAVFETPTWRASADWGVRLGYSDEDLDRINRHAVAFLRDLADEHSDVPIVVSGNLGPRGDGYQPSALMSADAAADYHLPQIRSLLAGGADMLAAFTITNVEEAIGIAAAARELAAPLALSFTLETDGRLPSGTSLATAIDTVDRATAGGPTYYMVNCAHPTHFTHLFSQPGPWHRLRGIRANASRMSHAELDEATELDSGNPDELADGFLELRGLLPELVVVGGCCGTDLRHVTAIAAAIAR